MNRSLHLKITTLMILTATWLLTPSISLSAAGTGRQALATSLLRVCADPDNLPFSNRAREGFENRIIGLVGDKLGLEVRYTWFPQSTGFVRNTLRLRECDLISGITTTSELVQNTNPYYHSAYTMVFRKDSGLNAVTMSDPQLRNLKLGVVAGTPPASIIARLGLLGNVKPYQLVTDTRRYKPARRAILDVGNGETDVAFIWGPIAAHFAKEAANELVLTPLTNEDRSVRLSFRVSMAVRHSESEWKRRVNSVLRQYQSEINEILREYDVPLLNDRGLVITE
ncbi:MAG: quinoprotein dehydrogenase-associated putative ABC transporter substrate-binding protein [Gammaproteobacteria bacterium]|nr:quinoprotein dehydrogenase-associated putative ABC transporter substrate-binding protein [Gammaproteobacteria bacterium]